MQCCSDQGTRRMHIYTCVVGRKHVILSASYSVSPWRHVENVCRYRLLQKLIAVSRPGDRVVASLQSGYIIGRGKHVAVSARRDRRSAKCENYTRIRMREQVIDARHDVRNHLR